MRRIIKAWKNEKGLTLVELLAVVVILGIISAIAVPSIGGIIENSKRDAHLANAQQMISSAKLVAVSELTTREGSTSAPANYYVTLDYLIDQGYLDQVEDPFSGNLYASIIATESNTIFTNPPTGDSGNSYVLITKTGNEFTYSVTLDSSDDEYDISDKFENQLTREIAFRP